MANYIEKMKQEDQAVKVHPGGAADLPRLNEILKQHPDYIEGIEFTFAEKIGHNEVQFYYDHPDTFTEEQAKLAKDLVASVKNKFMCSK